MRNNFTSRNTDIIVVRQIKLNRNVRERQGTSCLLGLFVYGKEDKVNLKNTSITCKCFQDLSWKFPLQSVSNFFLFRDTFNFMLDQYKYYMACSKYYLYKSILPRNIQITSASVVLWLLLSSWKQESLWFKRLVLIFIFKMYSVSQKIVQVEMRHFDQ